LGADGGQSFQSRADDFRSKVRGSGYRLQGYRGWGSVFQTGLPRGRVKSCERGTESAQQWAGCYFGLQLQWSGLDDAGGFDINRGAQDRCRGGHGDELGGCGNDR